MTQTLTKRALAIFLALVLTLSLGSGLTLTVYAENWPGTATGYTQASDVVYDTSGTYLKNWGARGENCTFLTTYAQNYYTGNYSYATLSSKSGSSNASSYTSSELYTALRSMVQSKQTTTTSYDGTRDMFRYTDCVNNNYNYISSFYSGTKLNGAWDSGSTWNREHTWPNSKANDGQDNDIMMLRPTAVSENSDRGNKAYGESSGYYNPNSEAGSTGLDLRGDCARIVLYCYVRWSNQSYMWGSSGVIESVDVLLNWMEADPVDTWEMGRNDVVQSITGVRNCFVDYPELAWLLFGRQVPSGYTSPSGGSSASYTVTAVSNNTNYGTVSVNGYTITASPKTGYYAAGYTVTSGTATVTQNGNTFTVTPSSDCTVRINFAARQTVTLTYMANGSQYSTATVYTGDSVTLPSAATAVSGWTVVGWSASAFGETTVKPEYYALGASYTPTASTTFYAVYSQTEGGSGGSTDEYTLVTSAPSDWSGDYVLTTADAGYVLLCDGSQSVGTTNAAKALNSTGMTRTGNTLSGVTDAYVLTVSAAGSGYCFKLKGASSDLYLMTTNSNSGFNTAASASSSEAQWTLSLSGSAAVITNCAYTSRTIRSNSSTHQFRTYTSGQDDVYLWAASEAGVTTYTTSPATQTHTHSLTYTAAVAPTCAEAGHSAYYYCAGCGKYFSDANAQNEITPESTVIPATGNHSYGSWSSNQNGTHKHTCSVCGAQETESCTYTDVVTAPTATEQGYTTHTCTVCGYSFTDSYTDPLGSDYTVTFSVFGDTAAIAPMTSNTNTDITLPTPAAVEGYTFLGWVLDDYDNVETRPAAILTGSYTAQSDVTLKALFTYTGDGGDVAFELMTAAPSDWTGNYVITNNASTKYVLKGVSGSSGGTNVESSGNCSTLAASGITLENNLLTNVAEAYVMTLTANGSYYTVQSVSTGSYYGMNSSSYLSAYTALNSNYTNWTPAINAGGAVQLKCAANGSYPYFGFSTSNNYFWSASSSNANVLQLWKQIQTGTVIYTTIPVPVHVHTPGEPVTENNVAPTCTAAGSYDSVVYCTECGEELSREAVTVAALGHDYAATVTAPTETEQGYTTHTCTRCGDTYVDSYVPALGIDYVVHFSVPAGVTAPDDMVSNTNTGITLPTVEGPAGYTFLGWVLEDYDNVETRPAEILTGNYVAPQEITLKALFTYNDYGENGPKLTLMTVDDTFSDGDKIVITAAGTNFGLYRKSHSYNHVKNFTFTNDAAAIVADPLTYFPVTKTDGGWYLGDNTNGWLYTPANQTNLTIKADDSNFMSSFALSTYEGHLVLQDTIAYNPSVFYLSCKTTTSGTNQNQWCMVNTNSISGVVTLDIYKLDEGGPAVTYYTTIINVAHEHTPAAAVEENRVEPTCTAAGSYDSVVYCSECGEELSRETVAIPALGHLPGEAVQENYVEPTATAAGGYDTVVYCQRCNAELSREHTEIPATGPVEPEYNGNLKLFYSFTLGEQISSVYTLTASSVNSYVDYYVVVEKPGADPVTLPKEDMAAYGTTAFRATYNGIAAKEMGVEFTATLYAVDANGKVFYGPSLNKTVQNELEVRLKNTSNSAVMRTLCADMLNYGAAAQIYFDYDTENLVNQNPEMADYMTEFMTQETPTAEDHQEMTGTGGALFVSTTLGSRVSLDLKGSMPGGTNVKLKIMKEDGTVIETVDTNAVNANIVQYVFDRVGAKDMRTVYKFRFVDLDGACVDSKTLTWSVEYFVAQKLAANAEGTPTYELARAMLIYGDSAALYLEDQN